MHSTLVPHHIVVTVVCIRRDRNSGGSLFFIKYRTAYVIRYNGMLSALAKLVTRFSPLYLLHSILPFASYCLRVEQKLHRRRYRPTQATRYESNYFHSSTSKRLNTVRMVLIVKEVSTSTCHLTVSHKTTLYVCQVCNRQIATRHVWNIRSIDEKDRRLAIAILLWLRRQYRKLYTDIL